MGDRQKKLRTDIGKDTYVRHVEDDIHSPQSTQTNIVLKGEVLLTQPEPLFRQMAATVKLAKGGVITGVAYPNAFIDPLTGNLHGTYEGVIPGQMVTVGFLHGNSAAPYIVNRYPYQGCSDSLKEPSFFQPMTKKLYDSTDVILGHFSGSALRFNTGILSGKLPGSISVEAMTMMEISANTDFNVESLVSMSLSSLETKIEGKTKLELSATAGKLMMSGASGVEITSKGLITISNTAQSLKALMDALFAVLEGITTTGSATAQAISPASVALLEAEKAKWALLFK